MTPKQQPHRISCRNGTLFRRSFAGVWLIALGLSQPAAACTPARRCGGPEAGYEVWCCGDTCNLYSYEVGAKNGKVVRKSVDPDTYC